MQWLCLKFIQTEANHCMTTKPYNSQKFKDFAIYKKTHQNHHIEIVKKQIYIMDVGQERKAYTKHVKMQ